MGGRDNQGQRPILREGRRDPCAPAVTTLNPAVVNEMRQESQRQMDNADGASPGPREREDLVGLIGGDLEIRARRSKVPPLDLAAVLAPYRREGDEEATRAFVAQRPLEIEIGFGRPHYLIEIARLHPATRVLGFEIKRDWVKRAALWAEREGIDNLRVIEGDARPHLERLVAPATVDRLHVLFPDPWWKKRHHKRRIFSAGFTALMAGLLAAGGELVTKTDVPAYVDRIIEEVLGAGLELVGQGSSDPVLAALPRSHREKKCLELEVPYQMLRFQRKSAS